jgi:hypothetical protein
VASRKKSVHLVAGHLPIATRWTDRHRPAEYYVVAGVTYDVITFQTIVEQNGAAGFTVQVTPRPRPGRR